jgi:probable F420-dependent oxidoreductase
MDFGLITFPTHDSLPPSSLARLAEERGYGALYFSDHTHIPASRRTPHPSGEALPRWYFHNYDVFVAVTAALVSTSTLRVGTGVCLVVERDPIVTAKQVASVDHLSGGRFELGVGAGWNREEMENHGTDPRTRMRLMRERVEAMRSIWTEQEASYSGEFVKFDRIWSFPKPAQRPHPPVLVGGNGPTVEDRVLAFGDGWFPSHQADGSILARTQQLRSRADRPLITVVQEVPPDPAVLERYERAQFTRAVFVVPSAPRGVVERTLDQFDAAVSAFQGA